MSPPATKGRHKLQCQVCFCALLAVGSDLYSTHLVPLAEQTKAPPLDISGDALATARLRANQAITHHAVHRLRRIQFMPLLWRAASSVADHRG